MKEVEVYLSARCITHKEKGSFGYVIKSESHELHSKETYLQTTSPRMMMRAAIRAMEEVYEFFGQCRIILYSNQAILINSMHYGHCKKFAKRPNKDLVFESKIISKYFEVHIRAIKKFQCKEIIIANELSMIAIEEYTEKIDKRNSDGPKPIRLF